MNDDDDTPTQVRQRPDELAAHEALLDARDERDELLAKIKVPPGIDHVEFAALLASLYEEVIHRAGLETANQHAVALAATPASLLALACGRNLDRNPLLALTRPSASA